MHSVDDGSLEFTTAKLYSRASRGPEGATLSVVPIELYARKTDGTEKYLGCATAFCDVWKGRKYLITNWHAVTDRNPQTGQARTDDAVVPSFVRAYFLELIQRPEGDAFRPLGTFHVDLPIEMDSPNNWFMHPAGQSIDIAALRLDDDKRRYIVPINDAVDVFNPVLEVGNELYILGFPLGLKPVGNFPIWKRGSIASEPKWQARRERCFWIDAATREGMSGSPVVARTISAEDDSRLIGNGPLQPDSIIVTKPGLAFVGVYSGRMGIADALEAQIGKVWHAEVVQEMLANPRLLDFDIFP
jgi:Trypsin-like peptidase domain